jgi:hypothetical protein
MNDRKGGSMKRITGLILAKGHANNSEVYTEGKKMKRSLYLILLLLVPAFLSQCATMHRWPDYERTAEDRMTILKEKIGEGLKTGALTTEDAQIFLGRLEDIRRDYLALIDKRVYRNDWDELMGRIDVLEDEINKAMALPPRLEGSVIEDQLITLQRRIDDARMSGRLTGTEAEAFQDRLSFIRSDYLRMTQNGRFISHEEAAEISRRLDLLETDLDRYR